MLFLFLWSFFLPGYWFYSDRGHIGYNSTSREEKELRKTIPKEGSHWLGLGHMPIIRWITIVQGVGEWYMVIGKPSWKHLGVMGKELFLRENGAWWNDSGKTRILTLFPMSSKLIPQKWIVKMLHSLVRGLTDLWALKADNFCQWLWWLTDSHS